MEQRWLLSIINSPLVVLKHPAYAYFKEISSEYVMYRTWTKGISFREADVNFVSRHLHAAPFQGARLLGDRETNLAVALNMQFKGFPETFYIFHHMPETARWETSAICHTGISASMILPKLFLTRPSTR